MSLIIRKQLDLMKKRVLPVVVKLLIIIAGSVIIAVTYNALIIPYGLLSGGVSGIALIGNYLFGIPFYAGILALNIPIFLLGLKELNWKFILYSVIGTAAMVVALPLTMPYTPAPQLDLFLVAVFSGIIGGIGAGIILKVGSSTGGTDIISMIAKKRWNISVGASFFYCNAAIIVVSLILFDLQIALYTIISMWVGGTVTDKVIDGLNSNKSVMIISEQNSIIAARIMNELTRGVTLLEGYGGYSGEAKLVINCVVNHYEIPRLKEIVLEVDPKAFMFITATVEVSGQGFSFHHPD